MEFLGGGGQISPFPIDFHGRPYNTLALPCECVMTILQDQYQDHPTREQHPMDRP